MCALPGNALAGCLFICPATVSFLRLTSTPLETTRTQTIHRVCEPQTFPLHAGRRKSVRRAKVFSSGIGGGAGWGGGLASAATAASCVWQTARLREDVWMSEWCQLGWEGACEGDPAGVSPSSISSAPLTRTTNTRNSKIAARLGETKQLWSSYDERVRQACVLFLRDFGGVFGDGHNAQFNPTAAMMHRGEHFCLPGREGAFLSPRLRLIQRRQLRPSSLCSVSLPPERPGALVPPALQWRLSGPGALWWGVPLSSRAARTPTPSRPERARACFNMSARVRINRYVYYARVCMRNEAVHKRQRVRLGLKEWVIQQRDGSQLLPAPAQLTAAAAMRGETPLPFTLLICASLIHTRTATASALQQGVFFLYARANVQDF